MTVVATQRAILSDLLKGEMSFQEDTKTNFHFESVDVKGSGDVGCIGIPVRWNETDSAFNVLAAPSDWAASTVTAVGDVVKPTTRDGYEYVCVTAGTTNDTEGEPTWVAVEGATTTETDGVVWIARKAYAPATDSTSPLPGKAQIGILVGNQFGVGFNKADVTLSATAVTMTVLHRGDATIVDEGMVWGSVAAADQAEFLTALEDQRITTIANGEVVTPSYTG